jgi:hypothetical protein
MTSTLRRRNSHGRLARGRVLVICLDNSGYEASLERRKIYVAIPDLQAERLGHIRIIDESGEDYLYPQKLFVRADLSLSVKRAVLHAD